MAAAEWGDEGAPFEPRVSRRELPPEPCDACEGDGITRFVAREVEAILLRHRAHLPREARVELELLRDALQELAPARGRVVHVAWHAANVRRAA